MMKFLISYFYKIRFFRPNMIPISTALWDPKWYHDFKGPDHDFIDSNGVYNGLRDPDLSPLGIESHCGTDCDHSHFNSCDFIRDYFNRRLLPLNFNNKVQIWMKIADAIRGVLNFYGDPIIVFIVHETPSNPCSERSSLIKWFKMNGIDLEEFDENKHY